jgi:hypothetical protein
MSSGPAIGILQKISGLGAPVPGVGRGTRRGSGTDDFLAIGHLRARDSPLTDSSGGRRSTYRTPSNRRSAPRAPPLAVALDRQFARRPISTRRSMPYRIRRLSTCLSSERGSHGLLLALVVKGAASGRSRRAICSLRRVFKSRKKCVPIWVYLYWKRDALMGRVALVLEHDNCQNPPSDGRSRWLTRWA